MQIERLEDRQLLAGAQLIGIQPNDGALLQQDDIRNVAPTDLTFRFDQSQVIDQTSLGDSETVGGIQITRANMDGAFAPASATSDFGTDGEVEILFSAVRLGEDQNGIKLTITKSDFGGPGLPGVSVIGRTINLNLNINEDNPTTALDLINALNNSIDASNLITAEITRGAGSVNIAATAPANTSFELGGANDIVVKPGYIGVAALPATNEVIYRFAGQIPDDRYRIDIFGTGATPLKNVDNEPYRDGENSTLEFELDLAPQIVSVVPQPVLRQPDGSLSQARDKIVVYFNDDRLFVENDALGNPTARSAENPAFYQLIHTGDTLENTDDVVINPFTVEYSAEKNMAILSFASPTGVPRDLEDLAGPGVLRLRIGNDEIDASSANPMPAVPVVVTPESKASATYGGVEVEFLAHGEKWGEALRVEVISSDHGDDSLPAVSVLNNVVTVDLNTNADSNNVNSPSTVQQMVDAINRHFNAGALMTAQILSGAPGTEIAGGSYDPVTLVGLGSSFDTSTDLGVVTEQNVIVRSSIDPQVYTLQLPGGNDDPGHRDAPEQHLPDDSANRNVSLGGSGIVEMGITRFEYNFREDIGILPDAQGNAQPAFNLISETQRRRAREVFQVLNDLTGVEFVETENSGLIVASGDEDTFNLVQPLVVMPVNLNDRFNDQWFREALYDIGVFLGLGPTSDLPGQAIGDLPGFLSASDANLIFDNRIEPVILSDNDVAHLRHLYYPESKDIDMYRFQLEESGKFTAETYAERQLQSSLLDTDLTLWRENADGTRTLIARNDNYFSQDSYVEMELQPGVYYVGVSASGSGSYDPTIEDTAFGGTTQGEYDLRFNFQPKVDSAIFDADNPNEPPTFIDGDGDGVPGGVYNFWFQAQTEADTIFLDKAAPAGGDGSIGAPYSNVRVAMQNAEPGQIVRIVGNPGQDGDLTTLDDNLAYQIGFNSLGQSLPDGSTMEVPQGVTVVIDSGAIFQLRRARIGVGSSAAGIDRSGGALQVLGAPMLLSDSNGNGTLDEDDAILLDETGEVAPGSVYFTSYNDQTIGLDTNPFNTTPAAGEWGGIVFRNDIDRSQGNFIYGDEGIFLNYVNHADMRYGGGNVLINSVATVVNPIHVTDDRPTLTYNTIRMSADSAMSASPDSFEETNFHAPRDQRIPFTSDYVRIGPETHHNTLVDNSINGLFVRVNTQAGSTAQKLTVSGTWNDRDIVHVMSENLAIAAQVGGRIELQTRPPVNLVTRTAASDADSPNGGSLGTPGASTSYTYKLTYVNRFGYESPASNGFGVTVTSTDVAAGKRSVLLKQLPPASQQFVARRLYRSENGGPFVLVKQLNKTDATFLDNGTTRGGILHVPPVSGVTLTAQLGGTLTEGTYDYRITFVDSLGKESRASDVTASIDLDGNPTVDGIPGHGTVLLDGLPAPDPDSEYVARRIYRRSETPQGVFYVLAAEIDATSSSYTDDGTTDFTTLLDDAVVMPRLNARLDIDPSLVVKLDGARFEVELGAQMIAEGQDGQEIIFTSIADDRYGAGGTFDTGNDGAVVVGTSNDPQAGDWGGIYASALSYLSVDHAVLAYGGGVTRIEGNFTAFNVVEIHEQSESRVANSVFEFNAGGQGGQSPDRIGRGFNEPAVVFVRQAQPVIFNNVFRNNPNEERDDNPFDPNDAVPAISINVNALSHVLKQDPGRSTGAIDRVEGYRDNRGPLVLANRLDNNELNGMVVRGQTLTTQSVWDDTDIVHVLLDTVYVSDFHTFGGLLLTSSPTDSLVVKLFDDPGSSRTAGFEALGIPHETDDRIGGIVQIVGQPGSPVVLTSLRDDRHGAGTRPDGDPQNDTNNDGAESLPQPGDWDSVRLSKYSHDRNVEIVGEFEPRDVNSPGPNGTPDEAQLLGFIAPYEHGSDENRRLGFTVNGFLTDTKDMDVYSFKAIPGTEVWIDLDRTTQAFDAVLEVLDVDGQLVARSDNSPHELQNPNNFLEPDDRDTTNLTDHELESDSLLAGRARLMQKTPQISTQDLYTTNPKDPGLRLVLPGIPDQQDPEKPLTYHVRLRSSSPDLDNLDGGLTAGAYQMQIRLREADEIGGSTVRYADISYARAGIEIFGQPIHSPLSGEATEDAGPNDTYADRQPLGNLLHADRGTISVSGFLSPSDVDFYEFDLNYLDLFGFEVYPFDPPFTPTFPTIFDVDYANGLDDRPNATIHVFNNNGQLIYTSRDSNVAEDRPGSPGTSDLDDLSRGSVGATDPFLGVVDLPTMTDTYVVAVTSDLRQPNQLDQFYLVQPTNPDLRLDPIPAIRRIAEDKVDRNFAGNLLPIYSTADPPQTPVLFGNNAEVPYHLGDVVLYMSRDDTIPGARLETEFLMVDPFTGAVENTLDQVITYETGDLAMHPNGRLYTYSLSRNQTTPAPNCYPQDAYSGNFLEINPGDEPLNPADGTFARVVNDDLVETYMMDPTDPTASILSHTCGVPPTQWGDGIEYNAIAFWGTQDGFAVGQRGQGDTPDLLPGVEVFDNVLYHFVGDQRDPNFGVAISAPQPDRTDDANIPEVRYEGAGTQIRERGELLTSPRLEPQDATIAFPNANVLRSITQLADGDTFTVVDGANTITFELDTGPEVAQNIDPYSDVTIRDGNFFQLDDNIFQLDVGGVFSITAIPADHSIVSVQTTINNQFITRSYEFDILPNVQGETALDPTATLIAFQRTTLDNIARLLADAINADFGAGTAHAAGTRVSIEGDFSLDIVPGSSGIVIEGDGGPAPILQAVDGSQIADGDNFVIQNRASSGPVSQTFEFDSGYTLHTPVRYQLQMPAAGGRSIIDGETFVITNTATGTSITFEFDRDGDTAVVAADRITIGYRAVDSPDVLATEVVNALTLPTLDGTANPALNLLLAPTNQGGGLIHLGSTADNTLDASAAPNITQTGVAGGITDGEQFVINDGGGAVTFEMDEDNTGISDPAFVAVPFTQADTHDDIVNSIIDAIDNSVLIGLSPQNIGNGSVNIGGNDGLPLGTPRHTLDTSPAPNIGQSGLPGVTPGTLAVNYVNSVAFTPDDVVDAIVLAINDAQDPTNSQNNRIIQAFDGNGYAEGQTLTIFDNGIPVVFTFDNTRTAFVPPQPTIPFDPGDPPGTQNPAPPTPAATMAQRIANAIRTNTNSVTVTTGIGNVVIVQQFPIELQTQDVEDRLVVNGRNTIFVPGSSRITDLTNSTLGFTLIGNVEESYDVFSPDPGRGAFAPPAPAGRNLTDHFIATRVAAVVSGHVDYQDPDYPESGGGGAFSRINFPNARAADFRGVPVWQEVVTSAYGVSAGNERIPLRADDRAEDHLVDRDLDGLADDRNNNGINGTVPPDVNNLPPLGDLAPGLSNKIAFAINTAFAQTDADEPVQANYRGRFVRLNRGSITVPVGVGIDVEGSGPGGQVTGLTTVEMNNGSTTMWAVSDEGGLYRIDNAFSSNATTTYIDTSANDLLGIEFSALTAGPPAVEGGLYREMLFASDTDGELYAFDLSGELQPVFNNGATSVSTGNHFGEIRGLAFSTLDENLFGITPYNNDPFPGNRQPPDAMDFRLGLFTTPEVPNGPGPDIYVNYRQHDTGHERNNVVGGTQSWHFGKGRAYDLFGNFLGDRTYEFPGGAYGSIVSNEFSLKGYSASDRPALYFSYLLDTQDDSSAPGNLPMQDAFRVFVADNDGNWQLAATNNQYRGPGPLDDELLDYRTFEVQEAFDVQDWRQVRVPLDAYAGRENIRIRIDFNTGGDTNLGNINTTGFEIRTVSGALIDDGDTSIIGGTTIEFDSGLTVVAPSGAAIAPGERMTIVDEADNSVTLQFVDDVLTLSNIIVPDGSQLNDGDEFQIDDETVTKTFEFDTGYVIHVPANGGDGIADQETFDVDLDGPGINPPETFEFDKDGITIDVDGVPGPDNTIINITPNLTIVVPSQAGLDRVRDQDRFNLAFGTQPPLLFEFDTNGVTVPGNLPINITPNLTLFLPAAGGGFGGVTDGDSFTIDPDGATGLQPPVVFEFFEEGSTRTPFGDELIYFSHFTTQDVLADKVVTAVNNWTTTLDLTAKNATGGRVILDGTTPAHRLSTANAPTVGAGTTLPTQTEVAERIIAALDEADGVDGTVLGLSLPTIDEVVNGHIILGGTTPDHRLDTSGSFYLTQVPTARSAEEIADRIATAINSQFSTTSLAAAALDGGLVNVLDITGGVDHTVDTTLAPGLSLVGTPGVRPGNVPVPFLPTHTVDEMIEGAPAIVPGQPAYFPDDPTGHAYPGMVEVINHAGMDVLATRLPFPDEEVIQLEGTAGNDVTFSPGVTALRPEGVIPIYVDATQTANDVAERITQAINQAVNAQQLFGVVPHRKGNQGYYDPNAPIFDTNLVNLEGVTEVTLSAGAASQIVIDGAYGLNDPQGAAGNLLAPFHRDMTRVDIADMMDDLLENLFHNPTIITDTGLNYEDGDTFVLDDGVNAPVIFEFDSGYVLNIPLGGGQVAAGGISDGESFTITDANGTTTATFEFDKNGVVGPGHTPVPIEETESALGVSRRIVDAVAAHPASSVLGLTPRILTGNRVQLGGTVGTILTISPGSVVTQAPGEPGVSPSLTITLPQTLGMQLPDPLTMHIPAGSITDGETFVIDDGIIPPVTFEFEDTSFGDLVDPGNVMVRFNPTSSEEEIGREMVDAINSSGLALQATMLGGVGNIDLGGGSNFALPPAPTSPMLVTGPLSLQAPVGGGAVISVGDQFFIDDGPTRFTFEFTLGGPTSDPSFIAIPYDPADSQDVIADRVLLAIQTTSGLNLNPVKTTGPARVVLGASSNVTLDTSQTHLTQTGASGVLPDGATFVIGNGTKTVDFEFDMDGNNNSAAGAAIIDIASGSTTHQIASEIIFEINREFPVPELIPTIESDRRIHVGGGANIQLDTSTIASITQYGVGGAIPDGQTFLVGEGSNSVRFEFDNDGSFDSDNRIIVYNDTDSTDTIAQKTINALSSGVSGLNIFPSYLGNGEIDLGGSEIHVVILTSSLTQAGPLSLVVPEAGGAVAGVVDGDQFTITDLVTMTDYVFEFDNNGMVTSGLPADQVISFTPTSTQNQIGHEIVQVVGDLAALGFTPVYQGDGLVDLGGDPALYGLSFNSTVLTSTGVPGAQVPHVPVLFAPSDDFTANDVGRAIAGSINSALSLNISASVGAVASGDQRRVELVHQTGFPKDIEFTPDADGDLRLETTVDIVKQDEDLLRIIGRRVQDPGPLGYDDRLPGDIFGNHNADQRGQDNLYEGLYLDDFVIGFTERGERVRNAQNNSTGFGTNPDFNLATRTIGPYELEIRQGPGYDSPLITPSGRRSMDTNDREAEGITLVVQRGLDIADTQTFTISDGVHHVIFEYVDTSILNNTPEPGRIAVPFTPSDPDYVVAQRVRDAINGPDAQAILDVTASIDDGTIQGTGSPTLSTSGHVNLFGPVTLEVHATDVGETNDTLDEATPTGIAGLDSPSFLGSGYIGDNPNFPLNPGYDVDIFEVAVAAGETLRIDVDANEIGSDLDPVLRVFDANGTPILFGSNGRNVPFATPPIRDYVDDLAAPDELSRLDPFMLFSPLTSGTYYIGVSGYDNLAYDSTEEGSGTVGNTGFYQIEISYGSSTGSDFVLYDEKGDANTVREQGQLLIHANTISYSAEYGIRADAAERDSESTDPNVLANVTLSNDNPHPGPVRNTPKLNTEDLVPGVVISNNVLAYNETGGIYFGGNTNLGGIQTASVAFGRIVNNTVYGGVDVPVSGGGPSATYDGIFFPAGDASFVDSVVNYDPLFSGGPAPTQNTNSASALGAPDGAVVSLGNGGRIVLEFTDNLLVPSGNNLPDLYVFETGPDVEDTLVEISVDGVTWVDVGTVVGGTNGVDIDAFAAVLPTDQFRFVRLTDDPNQGTSAGPRSGADIDAVGAVSTIVTSVKGGLGIEVGPNASPTILNNILADLATGIQVDASSSTTVVGGSIYQGNTDDLDTGVPLTEDFPIYLSISDPLFRDAGRSNFYLERFSPAIDSSVGSLLDRFDIEQVRNILGIADSPIIAPAYDVTGQLRVDDPEVETPSGFGDNIFIDRGAIDRSDFVGPTADTVTPRDNDADGIDTNPDTTALELDADNFYASFRIRLSDGVPPADPNLGSGVDDSTVVSSNVVVTRDGVPLVDGVDYSFSYNATSDTIVLTPLSGIWQPDRTYVVKINNTDHFRIVAKPGGDLPDGFSFLVRDNEGDGATLEFESGYTISVPQTLTLTVPEQGGSLGGIADGASFTVRRTPVGGGATQTAIFEFDSNGQVTDNNLDGIPDNFVIEFNVASTPEEIAESMVTQLLLADIGLSPRHIGEGVVHLGSTAEHTVDNTRAPNLRLDGQASGVEDGDTFTVDDGTQIVTFEFDNDGQQADRDMDGEIDHPGATIITFAASQTNVELAEIIATSINLAKLGLNAVPIGDGGVHLGGVPFVHLVYADDSQLVLEGEPGVRSAFGLKIPTIAGQPRLMDDGTGLPYITDGDTFSISDGTRQVKFELDNVDDPIGGGLTTAPNIVISYGEDSTVDEIADVIVAAIQNAPLQDLRPTNAGRGVILLGEPTDGTSNHFVDVSQTGLSQLGDAGVPAAVPVQVTPLEAFDGTQVAVAIIEAINGSDLDVTAAPAGGDVVEIEDASLVREINPVFESNVRLLGVTDLAGNPLKPNLLSGETQMTIVLGNVNMDFGDAPQTPGGDYPTQVGQNGAIHMITGDGLFLGERIDADPDGQISVGAIGDDEDSEAFAVDTTGSPGMTQSAPQTPTVLQVDQPLALTISDGWILEDGAWFRTSNDGVSRTFEFYKQGSTRNPFGDVLIHFDDATTKEVLAERVVDAVSDIGALGLSPVDLGEGQVHLGGDALSKGGSLVVSGTPNPFSDGDTFSIEVPAPGGSVLYTFEFEDAEVDDGVAQGNVPVLFDGGTTQDGFVQAVIGAVLGARLGIAATDIGGGQIELNGDDEDGVLIGAVNPQTVTEIEVTASADGLLDAWVDFNIDGDFNDPGEQIFASQQLTAGTTVFEITPPEDTLIGSTISRFRFSSLGGLRPTGLAPDGEVEDHIVEIRAGDPPVAVDDEYDAPEDGVSNLGSVLDNDYDNDQPAGIPLRVASYQSTSELGAMISMSVDGNFTYNPGNAAFIQALDDGEELEDTFTYRIRDNDDFLSNPGTVTVTIQGSNDDPVAVDDVQVFTDQNKTIDINVLANDSDPESHPLTIIQANEDGRAEGVVTIDTVNNVVNYDPDGAFNYLDTGETATDTFTYEISDNNGGFDTATVVVTIFGLNDPPVAGDDDYPDPPSARTNEKSPVTIDVLANDYDPEGTDLEIINVFYVGTRGEANVDPSGTTVTYDPNGMFTALGVGETDTDTFIYEVMDESGLSSLGTVTVTIDGVNDPPVARDDSTASVPRNGTVTIDVLFNDTDIDGDVLQVDETLGLNGTLGIAVRNDDDTVTYDPNGQFDFLQIGQTATDRFTYTALDGNGGSSTATVTVTVFGASDPPVAVDDQASTTEDDSVTIGVLFNDTDDFGPKIVESVGEVPGQPLRGSVVINPENTPNNEVIYSPNSQFDYLRDGETVLEYFTYVVTDLVGRDTATVTVTINGVNDAPIANVDPNNYIAFRGDALRADDADGTKTPGFPGDDGVLLNDTDAEMDDLRAVLVTPPLHALANGFTLNNDGTFVYFHNGGTSTVDTFQYRAVDEHGAASQQIVTVVINIDEAPPAEWQNPILRWDVNNDGFVSPIDVLLVINYVNDNTPDLTLPDERPVGAPFYDVNGDGAATNADVLSVITELNSLNSGSGEGEGEAAIPAQRPAIVSLDQPAVSPGLASPLADTGGGAANVIAADDDVPQTTAERREDRSRSVARNKPKADPDEQSISLDLYGLDDLLHSLARDVDASRSRRLAVDELIDEMFG